MPPEVNPFLQVHRALWSLLESNPAFVAAVDKAANRVKYSETTLPRQRTGVLGPADFPTARLTRTMLDFALESTSDRSMVRLLWELQLKTADARDLELSEIEWQVVRSMVGWREALGPLTWAGRSFVTDAEPVSAKVGLSNRAKGDRGIYGWRTVWAIETTLWFETAALKLSS